MGTVIAFVESAKNQQECPLAGLADKPHTMPPLEQQVAMVRRAMSRIRRTVQTRVLCETCQGKGLLREIAVAGESRVRRVPVSFDMARPTDFVCHHCAGVGHVFVERDAEGEEE